MSFSLCDLTVFLYSDSLFACLSLSVFANYFDPMFCLRFLWTFKFTFFMNLNMKKGALDPTLLRPYGAEAKSFKQCVERSLLP